MGFLDRTCRIEDCGKAVAKSGLCSAHYTRLRRHGDPLGGSTFRTKGTAEERFWSYVEKAEGCWLWTRGKHSLGYGTFWDGTRLVKAHRFAYELLIGPVPEGLELDHLCRNPTCVRPDHLEAVTHRENMRRGMSPAWALHNTNTCKRGHSLGDAYVRKSGGRVCRTCTLEYQKAVYERKNGPSRHNSAKTRCFRGHPYDEENTRWVNRPDGKVWRVCRACELVRKAG